MLRRAARITVFCIGTTTLSPGFAGEQRVESGASLGSAAERVFADFAKIEGPDFDAYLKTIRPRQLRPELRARILANLPKEGELMPSMADRARLAALEPIFRYHDRSSSIKVKVIQVRQAFVGLHASFVLFTAQKALDLLSKEELQAVVAHEMGHEYFWDEYQLAARNQRYEQLRDLELRCDCGYHDDPARSRSRSLGSRSDETHKIQ